MCDHLKHIEELLAGRIDHDALVKLDDDLRDEVRNHIMADKAIVLLNDEAFLKNLPPGLTADTLKTLEDYVETFSVVATNIAMERGVEHMRKYPGVTDVHTRARMYGGADLRIVQVHVSDTDIYAISAHVDVSDVKLTPLLTTLYRYLSEEGKAALDEK